MISTHVCIRAKEEWRGFIASNLGVWLCLRADPRKLKREKVQNTTSVKIATLENFPLYGIYLEEPIGDTPRYQLREGRL